MVYRLKSSTAANYIDSDVKRCDGDKGQDSLHSAAL